jgi:hypothetical protein
MLAGHFKESDQKNDGSPSKNGQKAKKGETSSSQELFDTGVRCCLCGIPLCVPAEHVPQVLDSLRRTGCVILICSCGAIQLARVKLNASD